MTRKDISKTQDNQNVLNVAFTNFTVYLAHFLYVMFLYMILEFNSVVAMWETHTDVLRGTPHRSSHSIRLVMVAT